MSNSKDFLLDKELHKKLNFQKQTNKKLPLKKRDGSDKKMQSKK